MDELNEFDPEVKKQVEKILKPLRKKIPRRSARCGPWKDSIKDLPEKQQDMKVILRIADKIRKAH